MTIPALTNTQQFQNQVNSVITYVASWFNGNINSLPIQGQPTPQLNLVRLYTVCEQVLFNNPLGTPAQAVTQLSTAAVATLTPIANLYSLLTAAGVTGLTALPAYTTNADGTVTLN